MLEWWAGLTGWAKYGLPTVLLTISTIAFFNGYVWPWGWGIGGALMFVAVVFKDEKTGWENHDDDE